MAAARCQRHMGDNPAHRADDRVCCPVSVGPVFPPTMVRPGTRPPKWNFSYGRLGSYRGRVQSQQPERRAMARGQGEIAVARRSREPTSDSRARRRIFDAEYCCDSNLACRRGRSCPNRSIAPDLPDLYDSLFLPIRAHLQATSGFGREGPMHKVAALQPAARGQEPRGR